MIEICEQNNVFLSGIFPRRFNDSTYIFKHAIDQGIAVILNEAGFSIPKNINILGFDRINSLPYFKYSLPTIEVPIEAMISELLSALKKQSWEGNSFMVEAKLIRNC